MISLEHIGIAVDDAAAVRACYRDLLGVLPYKTETVDVQGVRTHFLAAGSAKLELLEATSDDSPIASFLERRGPGIHHLAFNVPNAQAALDRLRDAGYTPLSDTPQPGADGKRIFFLHPKDTHGVLVECCEEAAYTPDQHTIPFRDTTLAAYTAGARHLPPLLLLHGAAGSVETELAGLIHRLEAHFRVVAVDFSGHGQSPFAKAPFGPDLFVANARAALDAFDIDTAHVFGFSMGGYMALEYAFRHPKRVRRLAMHGTTVSWDAALVRGMQRRLRPDAVPSPVAASLDTAHTDWRRLFQTMHDWVPALPEASDTMQAHAQALRVPALVSGNDRDDLFPLRDVLALHDAVPDSRLAVVPSARHGLQNGPTKLLADVLVDFFQPTPAP
ncbi:methylmalonyl-CoA epimerase [Salisaeta longa]|uniref:methylmalonyl-CoA epimerase n=1 Tax=Salisaeta longa TaxID=503170 RepID=UPI000417A287|nr:methylmalonyl-CoA epimerase [Salisaeta longa]